MSSSLENEISNLLIDVQRIKERLSEQSPAAHQNGHTALDEDFNFEIEAARRTRTVSGVYLWRGNGFAHDPAADGDAAIGIDVLATREEIRVDVDGRYPQMTISGIVRLGQNQSIHWIARLKATGPKTWEGPIWYKDGAAVAFFPFSSVCVHATQISPVSMPSVRVTYRTDGTTVRQRIYRFSSSFYRSVKFEYDCAAGITAETSINTHDHPDRPSSLPLEALTIETVFRRAGFDVSKSGGDSQVPMVGAGPDARWSDMEMHDAMQAYWSQFANAPQWSMWVFFAALHEMGNSLGGIMFDDIGPNHRQGTAIFNDSFIANPPAGDPQAAAWVRRMKFWTAVHEMGHAFNLAHSWQKSLGTPWIPLADEPTALSFMNYPFAGPFGTPDVFFKQFEFRFTDTELLFLRHAPEHFVEMGNAAWFDHHGFEQDPNGATARFQLTLRVNRQEPKFEFLEPVVVELKLTNRTNSTHVVNEVVLGDPSRMTIIIKKSGRPARQFEPFAHYCQASEPLSLAPGESQYESLFISAGKGGWEIAEPGEYLIQVACNCGGQSLVSNPLQITVAAPLDFEEHRLSQEFFTDDVARILTFGGSRFLENGNEALEKIASKLSDRRVAIHARVALANPLLRNYKELTFPEKQAAVSFASAVEARATIRASRPDPKQASKQLERALLDDPNAAAESLGHVAFREELDSQSKILADEGMAKDAADIQKTLADTLEQRHALPKVVREVRRQAENYMKKYDEEDAGARRKRRD